MRCWFAALASACACSAAVPAGPASTHPTGTGTAGGPADAASAPAAVDGGLVLIDAGATPPPSAPGTADAGVFPDGGLIWLPEPAPSRTAQTSAWIPSGAAGCDGLVPAIAPLRVDWAAADPSASCLGDALTDARGDLAIALDLSHSPWSATAFIPVDGSASSAVESGTARLGGAVAREQGFTIGASTPSGQWQLDISPGGDIERIAAGEPASARYTATNGLGAFVQATYWHDPDTLGPDGFPTTWYLLRWSDEAGDPLTPWYGVMTTYYVNFNPRVYVDTLGNALVLVETTYPMAMPCASGPTHAAWVARDGTVQRFAPVTPLGSTPSCQAPQFAGFGTALALPQGGFAFYLPPPSSANFNYAPSGWYASYASMSDSASATPGWAASSSPPIQRLASGAYLAIDRDAATCAATARLLGPDGQLCATLPLDGSARCTAGTTILSDGSALARQPDACAVTFWPQLPR